MVETNNPLAKHFRQPALYTTIPSGGKWYPTGTLVFDNEKELAVYPMTARDELAMNSPDALLNGSTTVDVIKSCVPGIKDPWSMPVIDMDTIMIAIRIATFGHMMDMEVTIPNTDEKHNYSIDLRTTNDNLDKSTFDDNVITGTVAVKIKPMTYRQATNLQLKSFEQSRLVQQLQDTSISPTEKQKKFNEIFGYLTSLTVENMKESVIAVTTEGTTVTDKKHIDEYVDHMDAVTAKAIRTKLESQNTIGKVQPITLTTNKEQQEKGAPENFTVPIALDSSNFFG